MAFWDGTMPTATEIAHNDVCQLRAAMRRRKAHRYVKLPWFPGRYCHRVEVDFTQRKTPLALDAFRPLSSWTIDFGYFYATFRFTLDADAVLFKMMVL